MGKRIIDAGIHYRIPVMGVLVILCSITYNHIPMIYPTLTKTDLQWLIISVLQFMVVSICVIICGLILLSVIYNDLCERNLLLDRLTYKRTIPELFRYFQNADPHRMNIRKLPILSWRDASGVILGKVGSV